VLGSAAQFLYDPLALARKAEKKLGDVFTLEVVCCMYARLYVCMYVCMYV